MASDRQLSRISLRPDQILEVQLGPWPAPPQEMLKLPGVNAWWQEFRLARERDINSIERMLNNLNRSSTGQTDSIQAAIAAAIAAIPVVPGTPGNDGVPGAAADDTLLWMNL